MRYFFFAISFSILLSSCKTTKEEANTDKGTALLKSKKSQIYAKTITSEELKTMLYAYSSDEFEGRFTGEEGQKKAVAYLRDFYISNNIGSPFKGNDYYQEIPKSFFGGAAKNDSENVLAFIEGSEKPEEVIIISAHLDHIGIEHGEVFNGADDDGSGTIAMLEIAQAFKLAQKAGHGPKRSLLFLHVTGEELGLFGSRYYTDVDPIFTLKNTVANLNIDMIGRVDDNHKNGENYLYLIGSDKLSKELHNVSQAVNDKYIKLDLDYRYNDDNDPNRFYYRSDHYNFAKNNVPVIFYFNGTHEDYHKATDTPDKINYGYLETRTRLIFHTAWELANRKDRVKLD